MTKGELLSKINTSIKTNGAKQITGEVLNEVLIEMVNSLQPLSFYPERISFKLQSLSARIVGRNIIVSSTKNPIQKFYPNEEIVTDDALYRMHFFDMMSISSGSATSIDSFEYTSRFCLGGPSDADTNMIIVDSNLRLILGGNPTTYDSTKELNMITPTMSKMNTDCDIKLTCHETNIDLLTAPTVLTLIGHIDFLADSQYIPYVR